MIDHPTVSSPPNRAPITVLECRADKLERKLTGLGRIFDALTTLPAPIKISNTVRRAQILTKRDEAVRAAWVKFTRATSPKATLPPSDSFQGLNSITSIRIEEALLGVEGLAALRKKAPRKKDKAQCFSRCTECGEPFVDASFEFCGEAERVTGPCKAAWLEKHPPACESRGIAPFIFPWNDFQDRCWYRGQFISATGKTPTARIISSRRYWCAECQEYLAKDHEECKPPVVVPQALSVNLLNVWKPLPLEQGQLRRLMRGPATSRPVHKLKGEFRMDGEAYQVIVAERAKLIVRDYAPRVIDYSEKPLDFLAEPGLQCFESSVCSTWDIAPPPPFSSDGSYIKWRERCFPSTPVESWYAEQCFLQLKRLGMSPEVLHDGPIKCFIDRDLRRIDEKRQHILFLGGKRVGRASFTEDGYSKSDGKKAAYGRGDLIDDAQRIDRKVGQCKIVCKYMTCGKSFLQTRTSHVFCTKKCCNLYSERQSKGEQ